MYHRVRINLLHVVVNISCAVLSIGIILVNIFINNATVISAPLQQQDSNISTVTSDETRMGPCGILENLLPVSPNVTIENKSEITVLITYTRPKTIRELEEASDRACVYALHELKQEKSPYNWDAEAIWVWCSNSEPGCEKNRRPFKLGGCTEECFMLISSANNKHILRLTGRVNCEKKCGWVDHSSDGWDPNWDEQKAVPADGDIIKLNYTLDLSQWNCEPTIPVLLGKCYSQRPKATTRVRPNGLNVRTGPGENYSKVVTLQQDAPVSVIGKDSTACKWLKIAADTNVTGWVAAQYITGNPCSNIPVIAFTPSATATSIPTSTPEMPSQVDSLGLIDDFEQWKVWKRGNEKWGTFTQSGDWAYGSKFSGKFQYDFPASAGKKSFFVYYRTVLLTGKPTILRTVVNGNGSGNYLNAWIQDATGNVWQFTFGQIKHTSWQWMEAPLDVNLPWPNQLISGTTKSKKLVYPLKFYALVVDAVPDGVAQQGVIYVDDLHAFGDSGLPSPTPTNSPAGATPTPTTQSPGPNNDPSNSPINVEILNLEYPSQVLPGQQFRPKVTIRVNTGQLLDVNTRGDMLRNSDGNLFGAHPHVAVERIVNAGEQYTFSFYENTPITAPDQEGTYESKWRVWANGNWVGPEINIHFLVRRNTPTTPNPPSSDYVCGQFIRLNQSEEKWPAFQPYKTNEIWIIAPTDFTNFDATFQEGIYVRIKKPDLGSDLEPAWGYTRVRYLIDSVSDTPVSNCDSITGNALDLSQLKQDILSRLDDAVVSTDYPQQAEQLVNTLFVHFGDFGQNGGSISQDTMQQALQGEEVSLRLNATVQGVWGIWAERGQREGFDPTSTDPGLFPDLSPFRRLIIRLIQGNQGSLSATEQRAFYSLLTRSEDVETWSNDMNAIVGAINRENFPNEQPAPTPTPIPPPQSPVTSVFLEMVTVPAGNFTMGSSDADIQSVVSECNGVEGNCQETWFGSERPSQTVFVDTFNISKYEVTNAQYNACVNAGICEAAARNITDKNIAYNPDFFADNLPVVGVSWQDASTFCNWLGERLPTEVEWEKAARGSGDQRRYPWGSDYDPSRANLSSGYPTAVGSYPSGASPYGMMDMAGNVFEWTATADGDKYILRGGGWNNYYYRGRVTDRGTKLPPSFANYDIGFRCVTH